MMDRKRKIMIVDDEVDLVEVYSDWLETDYEVVTAENGKSGVEIALRECPDLIISDIDMPVMNGIQMLSSLTAKGCLIPIIFITGYSSIDKIQEAWKLGAFDFLDKPVEMDHLLNLVKKGFTFGRKTSSPVASPASNEYVLRLPVELGARLEWRAREKGISLEDWLSRLLSDEGSKSKAA